MLKPGLKYSDGKPLTAKNYEYGWKRHEDPEVAGEYAFTGYIIQGMRPYILKSWEHQAKLTFAANPNYFRGKPPIDRIEAVMINDVAVAFTAYLNGELEVATVGANELTQVQGNPKLKEQYILQPGSCTRLIGFNISKEPFNAGD